MKKLKFPELSLEIQKSTYGAYVDGQSDPFWDDWDNADEHLPEVVVGGSGDSGGGGDYGGNGDGGGDYGPGDSGGGSGSGSGDYSGGDQQGDGEDWGKTDFADHYFNGNGEDVTLTEIGKLDDIRQSETYQGIMERFHQQVENKIMQMVEGGRPEGTVVETFVNGYDFTDDVWSIGSATVSGTFTGHYQVTSQGDIYWMGEVDVEFHDEFKDPADVFNWFEEDWDPGEPFDINDSWNENFDGVSYNYDYAPGDAKPAVVGPER